jgi:cyclopropane fatty-acyl-phospholipid synthase-like methyltransferase
MRRPFGEMTQPDRKHSERRLAPPAVSPTLYDEHYFLNACLGSEEWRESDGHTMHPIYGAVLDRAELVPGETLVDVGTGRGGLLAAAVERGAERAVGIEYSESACDLARRTLAATPTWSL